MTVQSILIKESNGSEIHADYYQISTNPEETGIIIMCHGLPGERHEEGRFPKMSELCNAAGFDALCIDCRGSGENVREPLLLSKQVHDLEESYSWAQNLGYSRIGTLGLSFGGITSLMAQLPDRKCAVFWAPAFYAARGNRKRQGNFRYSLKKRLLKITHMQIKRKSSGHNQLPVLLTYDFFDEIDRVNVDPILADFEIPTLILQGTQDKTVFPMHTNEAFQKMPHDEDHQLIPIENAGHVFKSEQLDQVLQLSIEWFKKYL